MKGAWRLRVLHVIEGTAPAAGTTRTFVGLVSALTDVGVDVDCIVRHLSSEAAAELDAGGVEYSQITWGPRAPYSLGERIAECDLVHTHGLWTPLTSVSLAVSRLLGTPTIARPAGSLSASALSISPRRKAAYWRLIDRPLLRSADRIHATAPSEAEDVLAAGVSVPSFVVPNPTQILPAVAEIDLRQVVNELGLDNNFALFLGRLDPMKNLDEMLHAAGTAIEAGLLGQMVVAGPIDTSYGKQLISRFESPNIRFVGEVHGARKAALLRLATMLILASLGENFGNVVPEALSCGTPVVVSDRTPWESVTTAGVGVVVGTSSASIRAGMDACVALALDSDVPSRAADFAQQFSLQTVAGSLALQYEEVLNGRLT